MTVHDDRDEPRVDRVHAFGDLHRRQLVGLRIDDLRLRTPGAERGDQPGPDGVLNRRQTRAQRLVNTRACAGVDEDHVNAV